MDDGDIAGEQVGKLGQKQRRPQIVHQPFVEEGGACVAVYIGVENCQIDRNIAFAAAGRDDHVHPAEDFLIALETRGFQRQPRGIGADPLPVFHLALIAFFRDLGVEADRRQRMNDVGGKTLVVDVDPLGIERVPMRIQPLAERRDDADAGDPGFLWLGHGSIACNGKPIFLASASMWTRKDGSGKGIWRKVRSALHFNSLPTRALAEVTAKPEPSCSILASIVNSWPGLTKPRILASFTIARNGMRSNFVTPSNNQPELCAIASVSNTPGMIGKPGKWPSKML